MSVTQHQQPFHIELPETITSAGTTRIYRYLTLQEDASIDELYRALGMNADADTDTDDDDELPAVFPYTDSEGDMQTGEDYLALLEVL
jgi:hypothetical protein